MLKLIVSNVVAIVVVAVLAGSSVYAADGEDRYFVNDPGADKYAVILVGASVSEEDESQFFSWATELRDALISGYGYDEDKVQMLLGARPQGYGGLASEGPCRAENIEKLLQQLSARAEAADQLSLFMFGYGSGFGEQAKFNIVGPDLSGTEFAALLSTVKAQSMIVVNTTSASYDFSQALTAPGRVVLSATRSAAEKYQTQFPQYFVAAMRNHNADRDKNQRLSALEAFIYASDRVQTFFRDAGRLPTEHSALDDNADGAFSLEPGSEQGDGRLAEIAYFDAGAGAVQSLSVAAAQLKTQMDNLERSVFLLRGQKESMSEQQYWQRMEPLLIELAKVSRAFNRERENAN